MDLSASMATSAIPSDNSEQPALEGDIDVESIRTKEAEDWMLSDPPPNGGLKAWSQVLAGHLALCNTWGLMLSFGIFQPLYVEWLHQTESNISWIGSINVFLLFFAGTISGRLADAGYIHVVVSTGLALQLIGVFTMSAADKYWQFMLAQGLCLGLGCGCLFTPVLSTAASYFTTKRMFALAIVTTGTSTGGMIFPAIAERLLNTTGFGWMIRVMGFVMLFNAIIILLLLRPRVPPRKGGPFVEWKAFLDPVYTLYVAGAFFCIWGNFVVYFYNRSFARNILHTSSDTSFELLLVMNAIGYPGRIIPAIIADRYLGPVNTLIPAALLSGIVMGTWMAVDKLQGEWAFTIVYGFFSSGVMGLVPSALSSLTDDLSKLGIRMGMAFTILSLPALSGSPIAGKLIQNKNGSFEAAQTFGCVVFIVGTLFLIGSRVSRHGLRLAKI